MLITIIGGCKSGKTNAFIDLICLQSDIDKTYLYAKHQYEAKYKLLSRQCKD